MRKQKLMNEKAETHFLANFCIDLDEIWYAAMTYGLVQAHTKICLRD